MALIKCPECGNNISEYADHCIFCGCPMNKIQDILSHRDSSIKTTKKGPAIPLNSSDLDLINDLEKHITSLGLKIRKVEDDDKCAFLKKDDPRFFVGISKDRSSFKLLAKISFVKNSGFKYKEKQIINDYDLSKETLSYVKTAITYAFEKQQEAPVQPKIDKPNAKPSFTKQVSASSYKETDYDNAIQTIAKTLSSDDVPPVSKEFSIEDLKVVGRFKVGIKKAIPDIEFVERDDYVSYRKKDFTVNGRICSLFWLNKSSTDGQLVFKYYRSELGNYEDVQVVSATLNNVDHLVSIAIRQYNKFFSNAEKQDNKQETEDNNFYKELLQYLKGKYVYTSGERMVVFVAVQQFFINEIKRKSIEDGYFKDEESFRKYKNNFRFIANLYGYTFTYRDLKLKDVKEIYMYFIAVQLVNEITDCEKIYNTSIISDKMLLIKDFKHMVENGDTTYSKSLALTVNFRLVSIDKLVSIAKKYLSFTNSN